MLSKQLQKSNNEQERQRTLK